MSRQETPGLPQSLARLLDGNGLDHKVGETFLLITVSSDGWPHVAMLSVGEIIALTPTSLAMALWRGTTTGSNLARDGKALLVVVLDGAGHYIEMTTEYRRTMAVHGSELDRYACEVSRVLVDEVDYARLTSGIVFELPDQERVVSHWRETVATLKTS